MKFDITAPLPRGTTVLEASAGTGKTWTIAALATRLVAEHGALVTDLLLITFTRAATKELRSRVRERFVQVARDLNTVRHHPRGDALAETDDLTYFLATGCPRSSVPEIVTPPLPDQELEARIRRLRAATTEIDAATITTIHGFCHTALHGLGIAGHTDASFTLTESAADLLTEVIDDLYLKMFAHAEAGPTLAYKDAVKIARAVVANPSAQIRPLSTSDAEPALAQRVTFAHDVRAEFQRRKRDLGLMTYDDLLTSLAETVDPADPHAPGAAAARTRLRERWTHVLVDEFQDTDDTQWRILHATFHGHSDLILIGDPKQAIYSFRGGDINTYLAAAQTAQQTLTLTRNYRSDAALIDALNGLLGGVELGHEKITVHEVSPGKTHADIRLARECSEPLRIRVIDVKNFHLTTRGAPKIGALRNAVAHDLALDIGHLLTAGHQIYDPATQQWRAAEAGDVAVLCHTNDDAQRAHRALTKVGIHAVVSGGASVFQSQGAQEWLTLLDAMDQLSNTRLVGAAALTPFFGFSATDLLTHPDDVRDTVITALREYADILTEYGAASVFEAAQGWGEHGMTLRVLRQIGGERLLTDLRHIAELMHAAHPRAGASTLAAWLRREQEETANTEHLRRLESDAAAVQIYTIHSAKGLQFPFVYLPTAATETLPTSDYPVFHAAGKRTINVEGRPSGERKAAVETEAQAERSRLLYVALTRAIGQVTVYWAPAHSASKTALHRLLTRNGGSLTPKTPVEDVCEELHSRWGTYADIEPVRPRPAPAVAAPIIPPSGEAKKWTRTIDHSWRRSSYTSLSSGAEMSEHSVHFVEDAQELAEVDLPELPSSTGEVEHVPSPMTDLPRGPQFGSLVHGILETVNTRADDLEAEIATQVAEQLPRWPQDLDTDLLSRAIAAVLTTPLAPAVTATLRDLDPARQIAELDFELPLDEGEWARGSSHVTLRDLAPILRRHLPPGDPLQPYADVCDSPAFEAQSLRGYLTGSIDLVFCEGGKFYVADYKTNWLGPTDALNTTSAYDRVSVNAAMENSSYPLQALLYTVALHRYLTWRLPGYDPEHHIGGVLYLYVRGMAGPRTPSVDGHSTGVFFWRPPAGLIRDLSDLLDGRRRSGK